MSFLSAVGDFFKDAAGSIIGAAGGILGQGIQASSAEDINQQNAQLARENRQFQAEQVANQMAFQRAMSSTAYQRAMADMRLAGLNPILAYKQGGAPMAFGSAATGGVIPMINPNANAGAVYQGAANSALEAMKLPNQLRQLEANVEKTFSETQVNRAVKYLRQLEADLTAAKIPVEHMRREQLYAQVSKLGYDMAKVEAETKILREALQSASAEGFSASVYEQFLRRNEWLRKLEALSKALGFAERAKGLLR